MNSPVVRGSDHRLSKSTVPHSHTLRYCKRTKIHRSHETASRDTSVGRRDYTLDGAGVRIPARARNLTLLRKVQSSSAAHRSFCSCCTAVVSPWVKRPESDVDHWPLPSDEHENKWRYTPSPLHVFTAWPGTTLLGGAGKEFSAPIEEDASLTPKFPIRNRSVIINPAAHHWIGWSVSSSVKNDEEISKDGTNETWYAIYTVHATLEGWTNARIPSSEDNYTLYRDGRTAVM